MTSWLETKHCDESRCRDCRVAAPATEGHDSMKRLIVIVSFVTSFGATAGTYARPAGNLRYTSFSEPILNAKGQIAFKSGVSASTGQAHAMFAGNPDNLTLVASTLRGMMSPREDVWLYGHLVETLGWIAIERGSGTTIDNRAVLVDKVTASDQAGAVRLSLGGDRKFLVVGGDVMTANESDPVFLRFNNLTRDSVTLFLHEEQSADSETTHAQEDISLFVAQ